jgi:hypothetical protein
MRLRVSIRFIMMLVLVVAVGFAALRYADDPRASLAFTGVLLILSLAAIASACSSGMRRAFWGGFAGLGLGYFTLCFGPWSSTGVRPQLATTQLLNWAEPRVTSTTPAVNWVGQLMPYISASGQYAWVNAGQPHAILLSSAGTFIPGALTISPFERIGHSLFALVAGTIGGMAAVFFKSRDCSDRSTGRSPEVAPFA